jgi:hypothetical protein
VRPELEGVVDPSDELVEFPAPAGRAVDGYVERGTLAEQRREPVRVGVVEPVTVRVFQLLDGRLVAGSAIVTAAPAGR